MVSPNVVPTGEARRLFAKDVDRPARWDVCNLVEMIGYATGSAKKEAAYRSQSGDAREDGQKRGPASSNISFSR
jgi:hypothetical protein